MFSHSPWDERTDKCYRDERTDGWTDTHRPSRHSHRRGPRRRRRAGLAAAAAAVAIFPAASLAVVVVLVVVVVVVVILADAVLLAPGVYFI